MSLNIELEAARIRHAANIGAIELKHGDPIRAAENNHNKAEIAFDATRIAVGQRDPSYARWWFYWPFLIALATLEVPVNQLAFQLYFGEGSSVSILITFGVGVVLVVFAHAIGLTMRRFRHNSEAAGGALASMAWIMFLFFLSLAISYSLAILRQGYLSFRTQPDPTLTELINQGRPLEAAATVVGQGFLHFTLGLDGWIFFFINVGILTVGVLASFWSHDPHTDYAKQHQAMQQAWKVLQRREKDRGRDLAAEQANFAARENQIRRRYADDSGPRLLTS